MVIYKTLFVLDNCNQYVYVVFQILFPLLVNKSLSFVYYTAHVLTAINP